MICSDDIKINLVFVGDYVTYVDHKFVIKNVNYTPEQRNMLLRKKKLDMIFGDELQ